MFPTLNKSETAVYFLLPLLSFIPDIHENFFTILPEFLNVFCFTVYDEYEHRWHFKQIKHIYTNLFMKTRISLRNEHFSDSK